MCSSDLVGFFALAPPAAGAVFAVGILLKIYPALLAGTAVWSHRSRAAVAWGLLCAAIVIAALFLVLIPELGRDFAQLRMLVFGLAMIAIMIWRPTGLIGHRTPTVRLGAVAKAPAPS